MSHARQGLASAYRSSAIFLIGIGTLAMLAGEGVALLLIFGAVLFLVRPLFRTLASIG